LSSTCVHPLLLLTAHCRNFRHSSSRLIRLFQLTTNDSVGHIVTASRLALRSVIKGKRLVTVAGIVFYVKAHIDWRLWVLHPGLYPRAIQA